MGGATANKFATSREISGLATATTYYFNVRAETDSHTDNLNDLVSDPEGKYKEAWNLLGL